MQKTIMPRPHINQASDHMMKYDMIGMLGDKYNVKILAAIQTDSMSIVRLAKELDIPLNSCYKKVQELENNNLIESCYISSPLNKRKKAYLSNLRSYRISYKNGKIKAEVWFNNNDEPEFFDILPSMSFLE